MQNNDILQLDYNKNLYKTMISVIVPVYRVENSLRECIESVMSQTYEDWEMILVDDGSPDTSGSICDEYAETDSRIHVIHQPNGGLSNARNSGLKIANGEYVTFLDSDDLLTRDCLKTFSEYTYKDTLVALATEKICGDKSELLGCPKQEPFHFILKEKNIHHILNYGMVSGKLYRMDIIRTNNIYFDETVLHEDTVFLFQYLKYISRVQFVPNIGYKYIVKEVHTGLSTKVTSAKKLLQSHIIIRNALDEICLTFGFPKEEMKAHYGWIAWNMVRAVKINYRIKNKNADKLDLLSNLDKHFIQTYYMPDTKIDSFVKEIICNCPGRVSNFILNVLYKAQELRRKKVV